MIEIIKKIPFFKNLPEKDLEMIAEKTQMQYFGPDHVIFEEGGPGDIMYVIKRGSVQVLRDRAIIAELSNGDFFGEMALVSDETRNATIKTITDIEVLTLNKYEFRQLLEANADIAAMVSYEVVKRSNANS